MTEPNWIGLLPEGRTINECTEAIETLRDLLSHYRRRREAMARSVRMQAIMADPVKRAEYRAKVIAGVHASHRKLPPMSRDQQKEYNRLRAQGLRREPALIEVFSPAGITQAGIPPAPAGDGGPQSAVARSAHPAHDLPGGARTLSGKRNGELAR